LAPRRYPENPDGNGVWPGEVLHGDHQLMRPDLPRHQLLWPDCFLAPRPLCRATSAKLRALYVKYRKIW
jgi:hypothetical protein